jgi:mannose/fructose/N-acetylgalactosamine-specific phosphotransferase system component IIC
MSWLWLAIVGGVVGLDATSFPQIMISRPLVAGILGGLAAGRPGAGIVFGAILEAFHLAVLPIGAARYPEAGTAAVAAAFALIAAGGNAEPVALLLTLGFALIWGRVAAGSVDLERRINERLIRGVDPELEAGAVERRHLLAMALDFARGSVVTIAGAALGWLLIGTVLSIVRFSPAIAQGGLAILLCAATAGALTVFGGLSERRLSFLGGVVVGVLILILA